MPLDHFLRVDAIDETHVDVQASIDFPEAVNGDDMGVVQAGSKEGFLAEALDESFIGCQGRWQQFQGDEAGRVTIEGPKTSPMPPRHKSSCSS